MVKKSSRAPKLGEWAPDHLGNSGNSGFNKKNKAYRPEGEFGQRETREIGACIP